MTRFCAIYGFSFNYLYSGASSLFLLPSKYTVSKCLFSLNFITVIIINFICTKPLIHTVCLLALWLRQFFNMIGCLPWYLSLILKYLHDISYFALFVHTNNLLMMFQNFCCLRIEFSGCLKCFSLCGACICKCSAINNNFFSVMLSCLFCFSIYFGRRIWCNQLTDKGCQ